ncbi:MAG: carboxypeptidase-like regulatory domain-containing protein, partial [Fibrobacterales bacterium]
MMSWIRFMSGVFAILISMGCSVGEGSSTAGTYIETTNAISGIVYTEDSTFAVGAKVSLRPAEYVKPITSVIAQNNTYDTLTTETNDEGRFTIGSIIPGDYVLEVTTQDTLARMVAVTIPDDTTEIVLEEQLEKMMAVSGTLPMSFLVNDAPNDAKPQYWIQVYGLDRLIAVDQNGLFATSLPAGRHALRIVKSTTPLEGVDYATISGDAGVTLVVDSSGIATEVVSDNTEELSSSSVVSNLSSDVSSEENSSSSVLVEISSSEEEVSREPLYFNQLGALGTLGTTTAFDTLIDLGASTQALDPGVGSFSVSFRFTFSDEAKHYLVMKGNTYRDDIGWSFMMVDGVLIWRVSGSTVDDDNEGKAALSYDLTNDQYGDTLTVAGVLNRETGTLRAYLNGSTEGWVIGGGGVADNILSTDDIIETDQFITVRSSPNVDSEDSPGYHNGFLGNLRVFGV